MQVKEVIDRLNGDIVEVISHFIELKPRGKNLIGCCPFHQEATASFTVSPAKGICKCFGCGKGGDAIAFIMEHEKVEFMEALKIGAQKLNLQVDWKEDKKDFNEADYKHKESLRIICRLAAEYFQGCLDASKKAKEYLTRRDFNSTEFNGLPTYAGDTDMIGYAPAGNTLFNYASDNKWNISLLIEAGLIGTNDKSQHYDFFRDRLMFPICDKNGKVIGFTGRDISGKVDAAGKPSYPKYINSPDTEIYSKGKELYALNIARHAIRTEGRAYLVEGNFDVKRMHKIGISNTIAPCGTSLTIEQARLLKTYTKNVTLIYDGDSAGIKAVQRNGELLVKEQFNVLVLELPEGQDPDSAFETYSLFEQFNEEFHASDYIIYTVRNGMERCTNPAFKSEFIKSVAALITCYDEPSLYEVYMDEVSKMIKPKKAWADQVKVLVAEKAPVERKAYIPKGISADELQERRFYAADNCYWFLDNKGQSAQHSNFEMFPLFHIESTINAKRLYELKNEKGLTRTVEIPQRDMVSLSAFQIHVESLGNFWFDGAQLDLNRLKRWLYANTPSCKEITQLGWQKEGFWAWGNGIFNSDFVPVDTYGIVKHGKRNYYIPAFSTIYGDEDNLYQFERKFIHMEGNVTLKEYAKMFVQVFGDNAKIALCFYFASLFRDIITRKYNFPILNMFGPKGAGKTVCAESLVQFFGRLAKAPNVHNTSKAALGDHVASSCNAIAHIDEYRNDIEMEKREFLKGLWDGVGRTRMNMDKDKKKETTSVDQSIVLTGQQMATADIALFSRLLFLAFTQTEYTDQERADFQRLKDIEKRGLTHITQQLLRHRGFFQDNFSLHVASVNVKMRLYMRSEVVEDRIFNNWMVPIAAYSTLKDQIELPWDLDDLIKMAVKLMINQNKETKKNDDLGNFWKVIQFLISSNELFEEGDYKTIHSDAVIRRYYENGKWGDEKIKYQDTMKLFYMTTSRVFSLYKSRCLREGDKPLPESTVEYYLKNSPAFLFETKKESFQKFDPKTGKQEIGPDGYKRRTSTSALVFNLELLPGLMLNDELCASDLSDPSDKSEGNTIQFKEASNPF